MPSLNRAYGLRGLGIALGTSGLTGMTQGALAGQIGSARAVLLIGTGIVVMIGAIASARRTQVGAAATWLGMSLSFAAAHLLASTALAGTPDLSTWFIVETAIVMAASASGCYIGLEHRE